MSKPTADWERVGDRFYRKIQLYTSVFDQDLELENYQIAGAPFSGAVALFRDETKIHSYRASQAVKPSIDIYSCAGKLIHQIPWDKGPIQSLGWSEDEKLIVVSSDGSVRIYFDLQGDFVPVTLGHGAEEHGVRECRFWSSGFVALLGNNTFIAVNRYNEPRPSLLAAPPSESISSWTIVPPTNTLSRAVEVLVSVGKSIMTIDASDAEDRMLQNGPFLHVAVSPNGKLVALYTQEGKVWVVSSDFQNRIMEHTSRVKTPPREFLWCGNSAVVLAWEDEVHLVSSSGASTKYYYESFVHLVPDFDGIKLFTNEVCEFIQRVPDETEEVFRLGSNSPPSILLDALDHLEKKSPKADDNIQLIRANLDEAVYTCVRAAAHEYSIHWQKQLLKAASFGKSVLGLYNDVDEFVEMTETLRVLNAVRFYEIGLPITYEQYVRLTPERLIERLVNRQEYLLALKMSDFLHLPVDKVYVHWARQKVRKSAEDDEDICKEIVDRLKSKRGISFEEIAQAAFEEGRGKLATELLDYEPRAGKQVPLLLSVEEDTKALDKAIESGDTDLVNHVLFHLKDKLPLATFFRTVNGRPVATALVEAFGATGDRELLKDLYYQDDRRLDGSNILLSEAISATDSATVVDKLKSAVRILQDSKEQAFQIRSIDETQRLLKMQETFEKDLTEPFSGLSVNDTIYKLIRLGNLKRSQKVQAEFKVADKTYWWIRLRALVSRRDWRELEEISQTKKSPIGWQPFVNEILSAGNTKLAAAFVPKVTGVSLEERIELWLKCGMVAKAGEEALKAKNMPALEDLRNKASGNASLEIDRMIAQLSRK